jgi:hypothetical protein
VTAIVVLKNGEKLDEQMLMAKVQSKLSSFKGPKDGGAAADARVAVIIPFSANLPCA